MKSKFSIEQYAEGRYMVVCEKRHLITSFRTSEYTHASIEQQLGSGEVVCRQCHPNLPAMIAVPQDGGGVIYTDGAPLIEAL